MSNYYPSHSSVMIDVILMQKVQIPKGYLSSQFYQKKLKEDSADKWVESGRRRAYRLFKEMSSRVPAYKDFLSKNNINPAKLDNFSDLKDIPVVDKDNYLRKYPTEKLCWEGKFAEGAWVVSTTSGSTGQPFYFPRKASQDWQYAVVAEQYLLANFQINRQKTLYIVGFPMGAWIGGVFTYEAIKTVADKGYDLSIITPGIHKQEIINAVKQLHSSYDQIIIGSYAPFLKDILEDGEHEGLNWKEIPVKFIFSAESFTETFRDYVAQKVGLQNVCLDTLNHYGTVDLGTMAHETPISIALRREIFSRGLQKQLFPEPHKQPTLCQYNPDLFYFEEKNQELYCSAYSGLPLFRYNLKDYGGIISYKAMERKLAKLGLSIDKIAKKYGVQGTVWRLPFVFVYERNDFSVSYYAFNVYPDPIRKALLSDEYHKLITAKFTMESVYDKTGQQNLVIHVERARNINDSSELVNNLQLSIHERLLVESSEYPEIFRMYGDTIKPVIKTYDYENITYFKPGTKQQWIKK